MYCVNEIINTFDTSIGLILLTGAFFLTASYIYYIEAIRLGFRDKTHAVPIFANMYIFAHDITFLLLANRWFNEVHHWLYKVFWFAVIIFVIMESVVHYQTIKYSGKDLFPQLGQQQYLLIYLLMQIGVAILFYFIYTQLNDFLFLIHFTLTIIILNALNIPMLISRGSGKGQSMVTAFSILIGPNIVLFLFFLPLLASYFRSLPFILMGIGVTILNLIYIWLLTKYPKYMPQQSLTSEINILANH